MKRLPSSIGRFLAVAAIALPLTACHGLSSRAIPQLPSATSGTTSTAHVRHTRDATKASPTGVSDQNSLAAWAAAQLAGQQARQQGKTSTGIARETESTAGFWGSGNQLLVLYDNNGQYGFLGELYAMAVANLGGHFGQVMAGPVTAYKSGMLNQFKGVVYVGSTYNLSGSDPVPTAFYSDVAASSQSSNGQYKTQVLWMADNIWNFASFMGRVPFEQLYGWDPTSSYSYLGVTQVAYTSPNGNSATLGRSIPAGADSGVVSPWICANETTSAAPCGAKTPFQAVKVLAQGENSGGNALFPWAIRSRNLTYIGEIPFDYVNEQNRVLAFEDMLMDVEQATPHGNTRQALLRLEDVDLPDSEAPTVATVEQIADYLKSQNIPFGFNVIPRYVDPHGYYNDGIPQDIPLNQSPSFIALIKYLVHDGGIPIDEGYTHQYSTIANPYDGVSGDDAEFFLAHVSSSNTVVWDGPIPNDATYGPQRVQSAVQSYNGTGINTPQLWITPHYFATDVDYRAVAKSFQARYERSLYFNGVIAGGSVSYASYIGEFFPYQVTDVYGTVVLPENLGDYEPAPLNGNPVRLPADLIHTAALNLAVRDGFASFFYDPTNGLAPLQQTIQGIKALGYQFIQPQKH